MIQMRVYNIFHSSGEVIRTDEFGAIFCLNRSKNIIFMDGTILMKPFFSVCMVNTHYQKQSVSW